MKAQKKPVIIISLFILLLLVATPGRAGGPPPQPPPPFQEPAFMPGEILVKFRPHVSLLGAQSSLYAEGVQPMEALPHSGIIRVRVPPGQEKEMIARLSARGDVAFAEPNYIVTVTGSPNDLFFTSQWNLNNTGQTGGTPDADIDAVEAWDVHTGSNNITIAIIDTGVDLTHPDLAANLVAGYDFANNDADPSDDHGHGTHVAGIAAAVGNNGQGVAGVSWNAKIMPLKALWADGSGTIDNVAQAVRYAVDNGAKVINLSLGARFSSWPCGWSTIEDAFNYAVSNGAVIAAASGNDYQLGVNCPGAYDQAIAVGSTTNTDTRSSFSNYGPRLDIAAPGSNIFSTLRGGFYGTMSGTSMATPHVAGLAALVWSFAPSLTNSQIRSIIETTADDLGPAGWDQEFGYGRINAWRALDSVSLQSSPTLLTLFVDDATATTTGNIQISTANPNTITWTTTISPAVSWLSISPPSSGTVSTASSPANVTLLGNRPAGYGTYTTTAIITGATTLGGTLGPKTTQVKLIYVPQVYRYRFPLIFKN